MKGGIEMWMITPAFVFHDVHAYSDAVLLLSMVDDIDPCYQLVSPDCTPVA